MIVLQDLNELSKHKALLAFSYGSDSTALFYLLMQEKINFDCALVNYQTRKNSDIEQEQAKELCIKYAKKFFTKKIKLDDKNFESLARKARYDFFLEIAHQNNYTAIILAHQLNDYFEWFLLSLKRGAGLVNLLGFDEFYKDLKIFRPLKYTPKHKINEFLQKNQIKYFFDESNNNEKFTRNFIRKNFSDEFVQYAYKGLISSFKALKYDKTLLLEEYIYKNNKIFIFKNSKFAINLADKACKMLNVVLSQKQRQVLQNALNNHQEIVISHKITICASKNLVFVLPFAQCTLPKEFKEKCRILKLPSKSRSYLYLNNNDFINICKILS